MVTYKYVFLLATRWTILGGAALLFSVSALALANDRWSDDFEGDLDCNNDVFEIIESGDGGMYVAGAFTECGGVTVNRIAHYTPETGTWTPLGYQSGNGFNDLVHTLIIHDGQLNAGGAFTQANVGGSTAWSLLSVHDF